MATLGARPAGAQEAAATDTLAAGPDTLGGRPDTLPRGPERAARREAVPDSATGRAGPDSGSARGGHREGRAPEAAAADTLTPAQADSTAEAQAADSLERVRRDIDEARRRLAEVRQSLKAFPQEDRLRRSPRGAVLRAFALPGWGQFYTGHTFRGFMYAGGEVGFATLGFLKQRDVNDFKNEISRTRLEFVGQEQAAHPDSVFTRADTLALFDRFERTPEGLQLESILKAKQKRREDYFTYAIFSMLFAAIDAFVSAHLEPYEGETARVDLYGGPERWGLDLRLPIGTGAAAESPRRGGP